MCEHCIFALTHKKAVEHFLLDCKLYDQARVTLFQRLSGLLENRQNNSISTTAGDVHLADSAQVPRVQAKYTADSAQVPRVLVPVLIEVSEGK